MPWLEDEAGQVEVECSDVDSGGRYDPPLGTEDRWGCRQVGRAGVGVVLGVGGAD